MAASYEIQGVIPTTELVGQNSTRQVRQVQALAIPSGSSFSFIVQPPAFNPQNVATVAGALAEAFNRFAALPGVVDVSMYQDVNGSGQFVNLVAATVESTSGNSTDSFTIPTPAGLTSAFNTKVKATRAHLDAIEAL